MLLKIKCCVQMKKLFLFSALSSLLFIATSCGIGEKEPAFDGNLIIGKWVGTFDGMDDYWRYDADGTGANWVPQQDVTEEEGQRFEWEFDEEESRLTQVHIMDMGGRVPKVYTMTTLNDNLMVYKDQYGNSHSFRRVNK